jgi:hypothetical protein
MWKWKPMAQLQLLSSDAGAKWLCDNEISVLESLRYGDSCGQFDALVDNVREQREAVWVVDGEAPAWAIGRVQDLAGGRYRYVFWLGGGDLETIKAVIPVLEEWARERNFSQLSFRGRKGWKRVLGKVGYREGAVTLIKNLQEI